MNAGAFGYGSDKAEVEALRAENFQLRATTIDAALLKKACDQLLADLNAELDEASHAACREESHIFAINAANRVKAFETAIKHVNGFVRKVRR